MTIRRMWTTLPRCLICLSTSRALQGTGRKRKLKDERGHQEHCHAGQRTDAQEKDGGGELTAPQHVPCLLLFALALDDGQLIAQHLLALGFTVDVVALEVGGILRDSEPFGLLAGREIAVRPNHAADI